MFNERYCKEAQDVTDKRNTVLDITCAHTVEAIVGKLTAAIDADKTQARYTLEFENELSGVTFEKNGSRYTRSILPDVSVVFEKVKSGAKFYLKHAHTNEPIVDQ